MPQKNLPKQKLPSLNNLTASLPPSILNPPPKSLPQPIPSLPKTEPPFKPNPMKAEPYIEESRANKVKTKNKFFLSFLINFI